MIRAMGIIRPQVADSGDRWALALVELPDDKLVSTRAAVLALSERLTVADVPHVVYRRPGRDSPWQLIQSAVTP